MHNIVLNIDEYEYIYLSLAYLLPVGGKDSVGTGSGPVRNVDFTLDDASRSAPWLRKAKALNYTHGVRTNTVAMSADIDTGEKEVVAGEATVGYKWSQTNDTVDLTLVLPVGVSK